MYNRGKRNASFLPLLFLLIVFGVLSVLTGCGTPPQTQADDSLATVCKELRAEGKAHGWSCTNRPTRSCPKAEHDATAALQSKGAKACQGQDTASARKAVRDLVAEQRQIGRVK